MLSSTTQAGFIVVTKARSTRNFSSRTRFVFAHHHVFRSAFAMLTANEVRRLHFKYGISILYKLASMSSSHDPSKKVRAVGCLLGAHRGNARAGEQRERRERESAVLFSVYSRVAAHAPSSVTLPHAWVGEPWCRLWWQVFRAAHHFEKAVDLVLADVDMVPKVARVALRACNAALRQASYDQALGYADLGITVLGGPERCWATQTARDTSSGKSLAYLLACDRAQALFFNQQFDEAECVLETVLEHTSSSVLQSQALLHLSRAALLVGDNAKALVFCLRAVSVVSVCGTDFPTSLDGVAVRPHDGRGGGG